MFMKKEEFYRKYANTPLEKRHVPNLLFGMSLYGVYAEIKAIDDKILEDEIRREKLLSAVEKFL